MLVAMVVSIFSGQTGIGTVFAFILFISFLAMYYFLVRAFSTQIITLLAYKMNSNGDNGNNGSTTASDKMNGNNDIIDAHGISNLNVELLARCLVSITVGFTSTAIGIFCLIISGIITSVTGTQTTGEVTINEIIIVTDAMINMFCIYFLFDFSKQSLQAKLCHLCNNCCKNYLIKGVSKKNPNLSQLEMQQQLDTLL